MNKYTLVGLLLLAAHFVYGQTDRVKDEAQIRKAREASNAAIARHDAAGVVRDILPDYTITTGRGRHVAGRDSLTAFWKQTFAGMPGVVYRRIPLQVVISKNDTLAWETGRWEAAHSYSAGGNYSAMWRKVNGVWRTQAELFVSLEK
jgi:ketosteroid isomerase-like protein